MMWKTFWRSVVTSPVSSSTLLTWSPSRDCGQKMRLPLRLMPKACTPYSVGPTGVNSRS